MANQATKSQRRRRFPRWRKWVARLLAVVLAPMLFVTIAELGLRLFGYGYDASYFIPAEDAETYLSNPKCTWQFFGPELSRTPIPTVLSAGKPQNTYRVFVFGGSAARGVPDPAFSFSRLLEAMLNDRFPQTRFEVVNTAMVAINSHAVLPIVRQCGGLDGDLLIVYLGNNEVVGPYGAGTVFQSPRSSLSLIRAGIYVRCTRLGQLLGNAIGAVAGEDPEARKEWGGMPMFLSHRVTADDPKLKLVYDHFAANLRDICAEAQDGGVPVIVSTVLTNLKDCPPFHSVHRPGLSDDEKVRWEKLYRQAIALETSGDYEQAVRQYQAAEQIDDQFAELYFHLGRCCLALKRFQPARRHFVRARDLDALRFRADTQINRIIRRVAGGREAEGVYLVDLEESSHVRRQTPHGIPGSELLHEHVHLNFDGNYAVAAAMFDEVVRRLPERIKKPKSIKKNGRTKKDGLKDPQPPSPQRCAELTTFTAYNRLYAATRIAMVTADPPFSKTYGRRILAEAQRLQAELTPEALGQIAQKYDRALDRRPDDLLLREVFAGLQSVRKEYASAAEQYRTLIRRYPLCVTWRHELGTALAAQGRTAEAVAEFRSVLEREPNHVKAHTSLASALAEMDKADEAIEEYGKALSIRPKHAEAHFELGRILLRRDQPQQAEEHLAAAVEADPGAPRFHFFLGMALAKQDKLDRAVKQYRNEVAVDPENPLAHLELGRILLARGRPKQAEEHLAAAVRIDPKIPHAHFLLGLALEQQLALDRAIRQYEEELAVQPRHARAHFRLGRLLLHANRPLEAEGHLKAAIEIDPEFVSALNDLAWLYATSPSARLRDGNRAVVLAERASELSGEAVPTVLDTLAAAYAAAGRFPQAVSTARKAIALADQAADAALGGQIRSRLDLYLAGKPFRQPPP